MQPITCLPLLRQYQSHDIISQLEMQIIEKNTFARGVSPEELMESAGTGIAHIVLQRYPDTHHVLILCGKGNNGGDGMVVARHLCMYMDVTVIYHRTPEASYQTVHQLDHLLNSAVRLIPIRAEELSSVHTVLSTIDTPDLIIDALLGTGGRTDLHEPYHTLVEKIHDLWSDIPILSIDVETPGIKADLTIAFHRRKKEDAYPISIGIPLLAEIAVGPADLLRLPQRLPAAHKGDGGKVLIIGGGPYQGAPYLTALAALRAGADLVTVYSPVPSHHMDIIWIPSQGPYIDASDLPYLLDHINAADVVICGNGLGKETPISVLAEIIQSSKRIVCDADALQKPFLGKEETVWTPHAGEFLRLTGAASVPESQGEELARRAALVLEETKKIIQSGSGQSGTMLLKGAIDIISDAQNIRFNQTGTPAMTVGGTGDVLAGVCGALLCYLSGYHAASLAAWIIGSAGEEVEKSRGIGLMATDLLDIIPKIFCTKM
ncbi:MAG: NAD(P)H-hydrate dehydratase [Methanomicrobiales archaeon]|jgi:NAD(P)H-hydrate epimerase|nr:NAD(P)H-hydrate dehydratase [Methanomicrobiales archaeon]